MKLCLTCGNTYNSNRWLYPNCGNEPELIEGFPAFAPNLQVNSGFKDEHFNELVNLEASNFWFRARNKLIIWALQHFFSTKGSFLEVGCGTGFVLSGLSSAYPDLKISASEISSAGLAQAAKRVPHAQFFQMDARATPFFEEFDVVGAFDVLEHIEDDELVISQLYRAIRKEGGLILTVPQHQFLWSRTDINACHVRRYSAEELTTKVQAAGFKVVRTVSFVSLLLPLMFISRLMQKSEHDSHDPLIEFRIGATLNAALEKVMGLERALIKSGINFPAGGSLLMIAKKYD